MQSAKRTFLIELRGGSNEVTQEAETLRVLPGTERTALREHSHDDDGEQNCSEQMGRAASCVAAASKRENYTGSKLLWELLKPHIAVERASFRPPSTADKVAVRF